MSTRHTIEVKHASGETTSLEIVCPQQSGEPGATLHITGAVWALTLDVPPEQVAEIVTVLSHGMSAPAAKELKVGDTIAADRLPPGGVGVDSRAGCPLVVRSLGGLTGVWAYDEHDRDLELGWSQWDWLPCREDPVVYLGCAKGWTPADLQAVFKHAAEVSPAARDALALANLYAAP